MSLCPAPGPSRHTPQRPHPRPGQGPSPGQHTEEGLPTVSTVWLQADRASWVDGAPGRDRPAPPAQTEARAAPGPGQRAAEPRVGGRAGVRATRRVSLHKVGTRLPCEREWTAGRGRLFQVLQGRRAVSAARGWSAGTVGAAQHVLQERTADYIRGAAGRSPTGPRGGTPAPSVLTARPLCVAGRSGRPPARPRETVKCKIPHTPQLGRHSHHTPR